MRVLVALGGNAMTGPDGSATPQAQRDAIAAASHHLAELVAAGHEVVITHGNGPRSATSSSRTSSPRTSCRRCRSTGAAPRRRGRSASRCSTPSRPPSPPVGVERPVAAIVTRTLVDADDPGFTHPTKPIGRFLPREQAQTLIDHGERWEDRGEKGWRRVVASPEPVEVLETHTLHTLLAAGYVVVTAGGGGIPVVRGSDGAMHGVEAVIDKDLTAALLARAVDADALVIATDVAHAVAGWGTPEAHDIGRVTLAEMEAYAAAGHFASGSMGPKVEAALRFVRSGGSRSIITALDQLATGHRRPRRDRHRKP